jgi:hypothetical protein
VIAFREATLADRAFIVPTWSRSFKQSQYAGLIWTDDWAAIMHPQFNKALDLPGSRAVVGYERDDPSFLYGWIAGDTTGVHPVVFFCYVKEPYRLAGYRNPVMNDGVRIGGERMGDGYGRQLLQAFGLKATDAFEYTCPTSMVRHFVDKIPRSRINPNAARYPKTARRSTWHPPK